MGLLSLTIFEMLMLSFFVYTAHLVVSQSCDINDEITRISMREAMRTEISLGNDITDIKSDMKKQEAEFADEIKTLKDLIDEQQTFKHMDEIEALKAELSSTKELMQDVAWQALNAAAAAACRGSTSTGGHGPWANAVFPKLNTNSCQNICAATSFNVCDADISVQGFMGKAYSYTKDVGRYYNYGCSTAGNTDVRFDAVQADEDAIIEGTNPHYYRFCCCRKQ